MQKVENLCPSEIWGNPFSAMVKTIPFIREEFTPNVNYWLMKRVPWPNMFENLWVKEVSQFQDFLKRQYTKVQNKPSRSLLFLVSQLIWPWNPFKLVWDDVPQKSLKMAVITTVSFQDLLYLTKLYYLNSKHLKTLVIDHFLPQRICFFHFKSL